MAQGAREEAAGSPMRLVWIVALVVLALDQLSKFTVVHFMDLGARNVIDVLPPYLNFHMAWNEGVNFGLFADSRQLVRWGLIVLALAISGWVVWWVRRRPRNARVRLSAGLLIGGALGNVIDRVLYGAVADFLNMSCCGIRNPYSFNVADVAIFFGAVGLILWAEGDRAGG